MLTRELIRLLHEVDPSGDMHVSIGSHDIGVVQYVRREDVGGQEVITSSSSLLPGMMPDVAHVTIFYDGDMVRLLPYSAADVASHYDGRIPVHHVSSEVNVA